MKRNYKLLYPDQVRVNWPVIRSLLAKAVAHGRGELDVDDILPMVREGQMGVMVLEEGDKIVAAVAFEVLRYPRRKILNLAFAGGRGVKDIADQYDKIAIIAREVGATAVRCMCRPSVARLLKRVAPDTEQAYLVLERKVAR